MSEKKGGDYDYGHKDAAKTSTFKIKAYNFTSQSDMPVRATGNYADNAMADPSQRNESADDDSMIDRLMAILTKAGVTAEAIRAGASLTQRGFQKVAARLDVSAEQAEMLLLSLRKKLQGGDELSRMVVSENQRSPRFSYEHDGLLNVTVRDRESGDEVYVSGSKGAALVDAVAGMEHGMPEEQSFLATYFDHDRQGLAEGEVEESDFIAEIASDVTTFNFPWKHKGELGTATAQCKGSGEEFEITVIDARDSEGEEIEITDDLEEALKDQAVEFIPEA